MMMMMSFLGPQPTRVFCDERDGRDDGDLAIQDRLHHTMNRGNCSGAGEQCLRRWPNSRILFRDYRPDGQSRCP